MHVRGRLVKNSVACTTGIRRVRIGTGEIGIDCVWRVANQVRKNRNFVLVIVDAESAPDDGLSTGLFRLPRKAELRTEVCLLRRIDVAAHPNMHPRQCVPPRAEAKDVQVVLFGIHGSKIGPAETHVERQVGKYLVIVLHEYSPQIYAVVLAIGERHTGCGVELTQFLEWSIVGKIPKVVEVEGWPCRVYGIVEVIEPGEFAAHLDILATQCFRQDVATDS